MTTVWWFAGEGGPRGPYAEDDIRGLLRDGTIAEDVRIWSSDQRPWPPGTAGPRPVRHWLGWCRLVIATLPAWLLQWLVVALLEGEIVRGALLEVLPWLWPAAGVGLVLALVSAGTLWWTVPARLGAGFELRTGLRFAAILVGLAGLAHAAVELREAPFMIEAAASLRAMSWELRAAPRAGELTVRGDIGPGFARAFAKALDRIEGPPTVVLDSTGGLVDEALESALRIENRKATVVVRGRCVSACIFLLMAGERRLAPYDGEIALHAISPMARPDDAFVRWSSDRVSEIGAAYLAERGAPKDDLDRARRLGPDKMFPLPAVTALDHGFLTGLLDGDRPIGRAEAVRRLAAKP